MKLFRKLKLAKKIKKCNLKIDAIAQVAATKTNEDDKKWFAKEYKRVSAYRYTLLRILANLKK